MTRFELDSVFGDWWVVTVGRSLDDIRYTVVVDATEHRGGMFRLEKLVALYECTLEGIPTDEHPMRGGYRLVEIDDGIALEVDGELVPTSYDELQETLAAFLGDVFAELDRTSDPERREEGIEYLGTRDDLLYDFCRIYEDLSDEPTDGNTT